MTELILKLCKTNHVYPRSDKSTIEIDSSGVYTVDIKDSLGCIFRPAEFEIMTDIKDISQNKNINIFPDISVNRQNINIVFKYSFGSKIVSKAIEDNINFELSLPRIK